MSTQAPDSTNPTRRRDRRRPSRRRAAVLSGLVVVLAAGGIASTWSGFSDETSNEGNTFRTAMVELTDNATGESAMFRTAGTGDAEANAAALFPGDTVTECIGVTYRSDADVDPVVTLSVTGGDDSSLAPNLGLTITRGTVAGTPTWPGSTCGDGFTASGGPIFDGTFLALTAAGVSAGDWVHDPGASETTTHWFQVSATVADEAEQNQEINPFTITWASSHATN